MTTLLQCPRALSRAALALALGAGGALAIGAGEASAEEEEERAQLREADTTPRKIHFDSGRKARYDFELAGRRKDKRNVVVEARRVSNGKVMRRWRFPDLGGKDPQRVRWNGKRGGDNGWAPNGLFAFRVREANGAMADSSRVSGRQRFEFYKHRFPLPATNEWGDSMGAGRNHQGQDLFARCGARVLAARGGRIKHRAFHRAAGYYLVVAGRGTRKDYVYMHLQKRNRPKQGARVRTGQRIGHNGETGNASGCHLHFELWSGPGWYSGGRAINPTPPLRRWASWE